VVEMCCFSTRDQIVLSCNTLLVLPAFLNSIMFYSLVVSVSVVFVSEIPYRPHQYHYGIVCVAV